ncbi:MAG: hypothetical protein WD042_20000 [Phycisphaeraceae bacterium]
MSTISGPISKRRIAGTFVALVMGAVGVHFAFEAVRLSRQFDDWLVAEPARFSVDLSRAGSVEVPFVQTCDIAHGEAILLQLVEPAGEATVLLARLRGSIEVIAADGNVVVSDGFPGPRGWDLPAPGTDIELAYFSPFKRGRYTLRMRVIDPVPALAGRTQTVLAKYRLCGLEKLPAAIATVFAIGAGAPALVVAGGTAVGFKRHGWRCGGSPSV